MPPKWNASFWTILRCAISDVPRAIIRLNMNLWHGLQATGPITFANYMQYCLAHPTEGYYMNESNPVFGVRGDFITSPEISQVFGEVRAFWATELQDEE